MMQPRPTVEFTDGGLTAASRWERPFLVDDSKWQRAFGLYQPVPFAEAVERTLTWFRSRQLPR